ncbi:MAG: biotin transporter BioY [Clostridiales bacterium]|nr:biotin transporter BioY [Clostridiales bacterium]
MNRNKKIYNMVLIAVLTAITCVLAPLSIPLEPVPISLSLLVFYFSAYILGTKKALISCVLYIILGVIGVPVFAGFTAGPAKLAGPTGGYIAGYIFLVLITGVFVDIFKRKIWWYLLGMVLGTAVCLIFGTLWLKVSADMTFGAALLSGVVPFIPGDFIKIAAAFIISPVVYKRLKAANLLSD